MAAGAPTLEEALQRRDFAAAQAILACMPGLEKEASEQWRAWLLFHAGRADEALEAYAAAAEAAAVGGGKSYDLHRAACLFQLRNYRQAQELAHHVRRSGSFQCAAPGCWAPALHLTAVVCLSSSNPFLSQFPHPLLSSSCRAPTAR